MHKRLAIACSTLLAGMALPVMLGAAPAAAGTTDCEGGILHNTTVPNSMNVPAGVECILVSVTVNGSIIVQPGSSLSVSGTTILGDVIANGATVQMHSLTLDATARTRVRGSVSVTAAREFRNSDAVVLCGTDVSGSVVISGVSSPSGQVRVSAQGCGEPIPGNRIGGTLTLANNQVGFAYVASNSVPSITLANNRAYLAVQRNTVTGNLLCTGNDPPPNGFGNTAGAKLGQCAAL